MRNIKFWILIINWTLVIGHWSLASAINGVATDPSRTLYAARQMGLGGVSIGFSNDANGVFSNPAEIAKLDTGGDMVASPLSAIKAFGPGIGWHTPGIAIVAKQLNIR